MKKLIYILPLLLFGCKKSPDRTCWKIAGSPTSEIVELPHQKILNVFDDIEVTIQLDSLDFIEINSYENLIKHIEIKQIDTAFEIHNNNKCNFIRNSNKTSSVVIHISNIEQLNFYGDGSIQFLDTIQLDYLEINSYNARSSIYLTINCQKLHCAFIEGSVQAEISGYSDSTYIFQSQYSIVDASNLENNYLHIANNSTGDAHVQANNKLNVELLDVGNVYFKGNAFVKISADIGLGKLISE